MTITFQQLLSLKINKKYDDDDKNNDNNTEYFYYDIQSIRKRWTIQRTINDFRMLSSKLSGNFQPLPNSIDDNDTNHLVKKNLLSKWISSLFWLMKGRSVKNAERYHARENKNMDVVLEFLCKTEEEEKKEAEKADQLKAEMDSTNNVKNREKIEEVRAEGNNTSNTNNTSNDQEIPTFDKKKKNKKKKTTLRLSSKFRSKKNIKPVETLKDLAESPLSVTRKKMYHTQIPPPPLGPPPFPVQSSNNGNTNEEEEENSLESFESVIASIVPQIVSEQVSKMRIAEKKQYEILEKKHKLMLNQSRQARKELEERYAKMLEESEEENEKLRLRLETNENQINELKQQIKNTIQLKQLSTSKQEEQEREIKDLKSKIQLMDTRTRSIISERDEAIALAVKSNRDVALLEEAKLRETTLRQLAHSAQETAEGDIHRQMQLVQKHRKAQKLAEGRLQMYNQVEGRLNTLVKRGELKKEQLKWLLETKVITPILKSKNNDTAKADEVRNDHFHLDQKNRKNIPRHSTSSSSPYSNLKPKTKYKFYNNTTNRKRNASINRGENTANSSPISTGRDKYMSSRIKRMSVTDLRQLLDKYKVPHKDCIEKGELIFRAQQAMRADETMRRRRFTNGSDIGNAKSNLVPKFGSNVYGVQHINKVDENQSDNDNNNSSSIDNNNTDKKKDIDNSEEVQQSFSSSSTFIYKEAAYETLNEPPPNDSTNEKIPEVFQNMVEPPPPPPPQAPAPHPYVKVDNNNKKNNANNVDNIKVHSEQPQYQPENQAKKVFELYEEQEEEQRELQETSGGDDELELLSSLSSTTNIESDASNPEDIIVGSGNSSSTGNVLDDPQIRMKIKRRKSQEEFETQRRASERIQRLKSAELEKEKMEIATQRHYSRIERKVKKWAHGKSLIRILTTMHTILPSRAPKLKLNLRSTADDVKVAYKKALRAVHPDKLVGASMSDRMKAEQMFKALRDAYALDMQVASEIERKEKESTNRANAYYRLSKKFGLNGVSGSNSGKGYHSSKVYHSQRWE